MFKFLIIFVLIFQLNNSMPFDKNPKLNLVDWANYNYYEPNGPGSYAFSYDIEDADSDNIQFRSEERHSNGTIIGSYGLVEPNGNIRIISYIADENGFRATIENSFDIMASTKSPTMLKAIQSLGILKKQLIHDQRTRPQDLK